MGLTISLIGFQCFAASRRFLHEVRTTIIRSPAGATVQIYPSASKETEEGFPDGQTVLAALRRPADLVVLSGHGWADQKAGSSWSGWWVSGRTQVSVDGSWSFYLDDIPGRLGVTGGLIMDCCHSGRKDFFSELAPHLDPQVPCLGVEGEATPRGTRHLTSAVLQRLLDAPNPNLSPGRVATVMTEIADQVRQRRTKNRPYVRQV